MGAIVHFASDQVTFGNRSRQRCLWCGKLLSERDWSQIAIPIPPGMSAEVALEAERRSMWHGYVAVEGSAMWAVEGDPYNTVPDGSCVFLDPATTA
jgi:hypothetical protein